LTAAANAAATVGGLLEDAVGRLAAAGVDNPRLDARLLVGHALALDATALIAGRGRTVDIVAARRAADLIDRRARREPVAHILGTREFWSLGLRVTADTLIPRPDSEALIEAALAWAAKVGRAKQATRVLDLGTGSGCLLLALLSEWPAATGIGIDISNSALAVAEENAARLGLARRARFAHGDWGRGVAGPFDVIVVNPPYVADSDIDGLAPEVARFEPRVALAGGADGLAAYRALAPDVGRLLMPGGAVFLEIGDGQADGVAIVLASAGLTVVERRCDLGGVVRCLGAFRAPAKES